METLLEGIPAVSEIHRVNLRAFLASQGGKFVAIDFFKKDGAQRSMTCRLNVEDAGGQNNVEALDRPYLTVFDVQAGGFRTINLSTVYRLRANGAVYDITDKRMVDVQPILEAA